MLPWLQDSDMYEDPDAQRLQHVSITCGGLAMLFTIKPVVKQHKIIPHII